MEEVTHLPILIIDDNPFSRDILSNYLGINGYRVEEAKNGKEALDYVGRNLYQLIIIYLIMPGMSGFKTV